MVSFSITDLDLLPLLFLCCTCVFNQEPHEASYPHLIIRLFSMKWAGETVECTNVFMFSFVCILDPEKNLQVSVICPSSSIVSRRIDPKRALLLPVTHRKPLRFIRSPGQAVSFRPRVCHLPHIAEVSTFRRNEVGPTKYICIFTPCASSKPRAHTF